MTLHSCASEWFRSPYQEAKFEVVIAEIGMKLCSAWDLTSVHKTTPLYHCYYYLFSLNVGLALLLLLYKWIHSRNCCLKSLVFFIRYSSTLELLLLLFLYYIATADWHLTSINHLSLYNQIKFYQATHSPTVIILPGNTPSYSHNSYVRLANLEGRRLGVIPLSPHQLGATRGVTVCMSAFLACHQCYCAGSSLAWGLNLRAVACGIFWSSSPGVFSGYSGFLPSFIGLMVQPIK